MTHTYIFLVTLSALVSHQGPVFRWLPNWLPRRCARLSLCAGRRGLNANEDQIHSTVPRYFAAAQVKNQLMHAIKPPKHNQDRRAYLESGVPEQAGSGIQLGCNHFNGAQQTRSHFTRVSEMPRDHVEPTPSSRPSFDLLGLPSNSSKPGNHTPRLPWLSAISIRYLLQHCCSKAKGPAQEDILSFLLSLLFLFLVLPPSPSCPSPSPNKRQTSYPAPKDGPLAGLLELVLFPIAF